MLREEFENMTGIYPTSELYRIIEKHYNATDIDKDEFCKAYKKNLDGLAERIQTEADAAAWQQAAEERRAIEEKEKQIEDLKRELEWKQRSLDRELEWKPRGVLSQMDQESYEKLARIQGTESLNEEKELLNEEKAIEWIEEEFGFLKDRIQIITELSTYDINRHNALRKSGTVIRKPAYNAKDWNYVRFDCGRWKYEVVNGQLYQYCD